MSTLAIVLATALAAPACTAVTPIAADRAARSSDAGGLPPSGPAPDGPPESDPTVGDASSPPASDATVAIPPPRPAWVEACRPVGRVLYNSADDWSRGHSATQYLVAVDMSTGHVCNGPDLVPDPAILTLGLADADTLLACSAIDYMLVEISIADGSIRHLPTSCAGHAEAIPDGAVITWGRSRDPFEQVHIFPSLDAARRGDAPRIVEPIRDWGWDWWERLGRLGHVLMALDGNTLVALGNDLGSDNPRDLYSNDLTTTPSGDRIPFDPHTWPAAFAIAAIDITPEGRTFVLGLSDPTTTAQVLGEIDRTTSAIRTVTPTNTLRWGLAVEVLERRPH